jgi:hypothetical protein
MKTKVSEITDGFGNSWPRCDLGKKCGMHVVRPGHAACWCENAKEEALLLMKENERMRNELARVNGQTMWICTCGGTDCAGLKENAALRADIRAHEQINKQLIEDKKRLDWLGSQKGQPWLCWETPLRLNRETLDAYRKEEQP